MRETKIIQAPGGTDPGAVTEALARSPVVAAEVIEAAIVMNRRLKIARRREPAANDGGGGDRSLRIASSRKGKQESTARLEVPEGGRSERRWNITEASGFSPQTDGCRAVRGRSAIPRNVVCPASRQSSRPTPESRAVDKSAALAIPGVVAVLTAEDLPIVHDAPWQPVQDADG